MSEFFYECVDFLHFLIGFCTSFFMILNQQILALFIISGRYNDIREHTILISQLHGPISASHCVFFTLQGKYIKHFIKLKVNEGKQINSEATISISVQPMYCYLFCLYPFYI